jgi:hypothetical protein
MASELKFTDDLKELLDSDMHSTKHTLRQILELFHKGCKKFAMQLNGGVIEKVGLGMHFC